MTINTEADVNSETVRELRKSLNLSQTKFWGAICVTLSKGNAYETGRTKIVPPEVCRLVYLHYIAGLATDATKDELKGAVAMVRKARQARDQITRASKQVQQAHELLLSAGAEIQTTSTKGK